MDIRKRKIDPKMDAKSKKQLREAKKVYKLKKTVTHEEKQFMDGIDDLLGSPSQEQKRIEEFEKYARD